MSLRIRNDQYLEDLIGVVAQPVNQALRRMREEDSKLESGPSHTVRVNQKTNENL